MHGTQIIIPKLGKDQGIVLALSFKINTTGENNDVILKC